MLIDTLAAGLLLTIGTLALRLLGLLREPSQGACHGARMK
jgi:hypothetical protein